MIVPRKNLEQIEPYIPGKPIEELQREYGIDNVLKLASNENTLGPSPRAKKVICESTSELALYPDGNSTYLKEALADSLNLAEENLVIANGSDGILKLLGETYLEPGDKTVFAAPSFVEYKFITQLMGASMEVVPLDQYLVHDLESMAEAAEDPEVKMVFICNPNNPTGTMVDKEQMDSFMNRIPDDVLVVIDEAYCEYVTSDAYPDGVDYVRQGREVIVLRTFSKIHALAALRIGYGIAGERVIADMHKALEPFNVNRLAQKAALASLHDKEHIEKCRQKNIEGRSYLYSEFKDMNLEYIDSQANFVLFKVPVDSLKLYENLLRKGIIVRAGDNLGCPGCIRVTIGSQNENERFIKALKQALKELC